MSATGSGISEIFGFTLAAGGAAGSQVNFTHNLGTRAIQVYCCDAVTGRQLDGTEISVAQPTANVVQIANITTGAVVVNISIRWQYDTVELDTVPTTDARLATAVGPAPVAGGIVGGGALNQVTYWTGAATIAGNAFLTTDPATGDLDRIKNVPYDWPAANAAGVLTNDGAGNLTWAAGGAGANTALSNLAAVAVNAALNPGLDNTIGIGTSALRWSVVNATDLFARADNTNTVRTQYGATAITTAAGGAGFTLDASAPAETLNIFSDGTMLISSAAGMIQLFGSGVTAIELNGSGSGDDIVARQMNRLIVDGSNGMRLQSAQGPVNGGTAAIPAFALGLATTTGFFQNVASELGVTNAGVETMRFTADNALEINASTAAVSAAGKGRIRYLAASNTLQFSNNGAAYAGLIGGSTTLVNGRVTLSSGGATITDNANLTFNGTVLAINQDGTAALPSLTMGTAADPNTGIFHPAADEIAVSAGGAERRRIRNAAAAGTGRILTTLGTLSTDGEWGDYTTGTFLAGALIDAYMMRVEGTGAGSASGRQFALLGTIGAGYTGTARTGGVFGANSSVNPAPAAGDFNNVNGSIGVYGQSAGAGAGYNYGAVGNAIGGSAVATNILTGGYFRASTGFANNTTIGVIGVGGSTGAGPTRIGGFFSNGYTNGADGGTPTLAGVNGAVVADSVATGAAIFRGRNSAVDRFMVMETGITSILVDGTAAAPALYFGGTADPNTGIFHPAADTLALSTNGTEAMRIISTGEIGVGNAITPASNVMIQATRTTNSGVSIGVTNAQNGTAGLASVSATSDVGAVLITAFSSGFTTTASTIASAGRLESSSGLSAGLVLSVGASGAPMLFYTNLAGTRAERARLFATGNWSFGGTTDLGQVAIDNGATAESILVLLDNGTAVVTVADGGDTGIGVTPTEKLSLKDHTAFAGSETQLTTGAVQTTNGTTTQAKTLALSDNTLYWFEADIIGRDTTGTDRAYYKVAALFYRQGGGAATLQGAVASVITAIETAGAAAWDGTLAASGNNVVVNVTGAAATTINWTCTVRYQAVSGNA